MRMVEFIQVKSFLIDKMSTSSWMIISMKNDLQKQSSRLYNHHTYAKNLINKHNQTINIKKGLHQHTWRSFFNNGGAGNTLGRRGNPLPTASRAPGRGSPLPMASHTPYNKSEA
jgi:hypothetical protein